MTNPPKRAGDTQAQAPQPGSHGSAASTILRHTFATFALRAGVSTFDLSRYMGASPTMIDRHYGYVARDGRDHTITSSTLTRALTRPVSTAWTSRGHST